MFPYIHYFWCVNITNILKVMLDGPLRPLVRLAPVSPTRVVTYYLLVTSCSLFIHR